MAEPLFDEEDEREERRVRKTAAKEEVAADVQEERKKYWGDVLAKAQLLEVTDAAVYEGKNGGKIIIFTDALYRPLLQGLAFHIPPALVERLGKK